MQTCELHTMHLMSTLRELSDTAAPDDALEASPPIVDLLETLARVPANRRIIWKWYAAHQDADEW
jgi:hypothetical protein